MTLVPPVPAAAPVAAGLPVPAPRPADTEPGPAREQTPAATPEPAPAPEPAPEPVGPAPTATPGPRLRHVRTGPPAGAPGERDDQPPRVPGTPPRFGVVAVPRPSRTTSDRRGGTPSVRPVRLTDITADPVGPPGAVERPAAVTPVPLPVPRPAVHDGQDAPAGPDVPAGPDACAGPDASVGPATPAGPDTPAGPAAPAVPPPTESRTEEPQP
ncbi:hypothetical protein ACFVFF_28140 [Streptomyces sp. NPDC057680]|uniref:hypothetical protein n=1 Tax=Streptomyces sp. NPDC057680 TaxID=3346208 RepID=UPI00367FAC0C